MFPKIYSVRQGLWHHVYNNSGTYGFPWKVFSGNWWSVSLSVVGAAAWDAVGYDSDAVMKEYAERILLKSRSGDTTGHGIRMHGTHLFCFSIHVIATNTEFSLA